MQLQAAQRSVTGTKGLSALRGKGVMPAIVYGPKQEALAIEVPLSDFAKVLEEAGESTVVQLMVGETEHNVLIHEVDRDPVTDVPRHADFYAIVKGQKVKVDVSLSFVGESPAVKQGANLVKVLHEIEIEAEAMHLPHEILVDISSLDALDKQILAGDIALPTGVTLVTGAEEVVALVAAAKEEEEVPVAGPDMTAIGISEERGKKEEEGAENAPSEPAKE